MTGTIPVPSRKLAAALAAVWLSLAGSASADLVVLTGGEVLKVRAYEVRGEKAQLELATGGALTLPLVRIDRVVDDEIEPPGEAVSLPDPGVVYAIDFQPGQGVPATRFGAEIARAAEAARLNPHLVAAVVAAESGFDPRAVSPKGARGLMQMMPGTGARFGLAPRELYDPVKNLTAGTTYLRWLLDRFDGSLLLALAGYNAGEGAVERFGGVPPYRETRRYVRRVYDRLTNGASSGR